MTKSLERHQPIWDSMPSGDVVVLEGAGVGSHAGVQNRTEDGNMVWVSNEFNEQKLVYFEDCTGAGIVNSSTCATR